VSLGLALGLTLGLALGLWESHRLSLIWIKIRKKIISFWKTLSAFYPNLRYDF
jgi:hypothetical protein